MWLVLSIPRQNLMQGFRAIYNLTFSDKGRFGYQMQHAKLNGVVRESYITLFHEGMIGSYSAYKEIVFL